MKTFKQRPAEAMKDWQTALYVDDGVLAGGRVGEAVVQGRGAERDRRAEAGRQPEVPPLVHAQEHEGTRKCQVGGPAAEPRLLLTSADSRAFGGALSSRYCIGGVWACRCIGVLRNRPRNLFIYVL